ncbi:MAG: glycosyltransferase, partial [Kiritimatiellia bacterium]
VVASAVGGIPEVVEDGRNGLLIPPEDDAALAAALIRLANDAQLRAALATAAQNTVRSAFRLKKMVERTEQIYRETLERVRRKS